jgi:hypothetical protein
MERSLNTAANTMTSHSAATNTVATTPVASSRANEWQAGLRWLVPLWRHAVWFVALFALLTLWVDIRVEVQQLRKDLDRSGRAFREARVHNDRLRLELDARSRAFALEAAAGELGLSDRASLVDIPAQDVPAQEIPAQQTGGAHD